jgi:hypothetical protein
MADKKSNSVTLMGSTQYGQDWGSALSQASGAANGGSQNMLASSGFQGKSVYMGGTYVPGIGYGTFGSTPGQGYQSYDQAIMAPLDWSDSQVSQFVNTGIINKVPGFDVGMGMPQIQAAWQQMVDSSVAFNQYTKMGEKPWSPWDVLNSWQDNKGKFGTQKQGDWEYDVATGERIRYLGKKSKTSTDKKVDLTSAADVKAIATQALREMLGRAPTAKEMAQFKASINAEERANPTISTTTATLSDDEINAAIAGNRDVDWSTATTDTQTSGGVSDAARAALISDPTMQTKEYGKYQSATTYWDSMMQMLAGGS